MGFVEKYSNCGNLDYFANSGNVKLFWQFWKLKRFRKFDFQACLCTMRLKDFLTVNVVLKTVVWVKDTKRKIRKTKFIYGSSRSAVTSGEV